MTAEIGQRIRRMRMRMGLSQARLAADLEVSGSYLSLLESGRRMPTADLYERLTARLGCPAGYLETGRGGVEDDPVELELKFAELALRSGEAEAAERRFTAVLDGTDGQSHEAALIEARWGRARAREAQGHLEAAIEDFESLATVEELPPTVSRLAIATALSRAYSECGELGRAVDVGEAALATIRADVPQDESVALVSTLVGCYYERGDLVRAHSLARTALASAETADTPIARASALWNASLVAEARGDLRTARAYADRALALYSESDNERAVALLRIVAAWLLLREPEPPIDEAEQLLGRALADLESVGSPVDVAYGETELARCRLLSGDWRDAIDIAERSLAHLGAGPRIESARARLVIGKAALIGGYPDDATRAFDAAVADLRAFGAHWQAASAWRELAEAMASMGRADDALDAYRSASDAAGISRPSEPSRSHAAARRT